MVLYEVRDTSVGLRVALIADTVTNSFLNPRQMTRRHGTATWQA